MFSRTIPLTYSGHGRPYEMSSQTFSHYAHQATRTGLYRQLAPDSRTIRLLHLLPSNPDAPGICCKLREYTLSEIAGQYNTLSYTWGDGLSETNRFYGRQPTTVLCNNILIDVTPNLYGALHRLRDSLKSPILWADSLCINQTDNEERAQQVGMMREIYANCSQVIIWLGEEEASPGALEEVKFYGDKRDNDRVEAYKRQLSSPAQRRVTTPGPEDIYGAFCLLSMLAQGQLPSTTWFLRNLYFAPPAIQGLNAILNKLWVGNFPRWPLFLFAPLNNPLMTGKADIGVS